jgi:hypothetical protein
MVTLEQEGLVVEVGVGVAMVALVAAAVVVLLSAAAVVRLVS